MEAIDTGFEGLYFIKLQKKTDVRGYFARSYCGEEFESFGIDMQIKQCSVCHNIKQGTIRGMHYQAEPYAEKKLVMCIKGEIYDVVIDLRKDSDTYLNWKSFILNEDSHSLLYIPKGFAHGYQTLKPHTELFYQISEYYYPGAGRGIRWNDPLFNIDWPDIKPRVSDRDANYSDYLK